MLPSLILQGHAACRWCPPRVGGQRIRRYWVNCRNANWSICCAALADPVGGTYIPGRVSSASSPPLEFAGFLIYSSLPTFRSMLDLLLFSRISPSSRTIPGTLKSSPRPSIPVLSSPRAFQRGPWRLTADNNVTRDTDRLPQFPNNAQQGLGQSLRG